MNAECKDVTSEQDQVDGAAGATLTAEQLEAVSGGRHHHRHHRAYYGAPGYAAYAPAAYPVVAATRYRRRYY